MQPVTLLSLAATLNAVLSAAAPPTIKTTQPVEISRLNECIQGRFQDRESFGMNRIAPFNFHGLRRFVPETPTEQALVEQLKQKGFEVAVFLVGRQALNPAAIPNRRSGLQGPAFVTPARDLQDAAGLFAAGQSALAANSDGRDIQKDSWSVTMRPLRASNQGCISCHTSVDSKPKLGDALGVVMYVYRQGK